MGMYCEISAASRDDLEQLSADLSSGGVASPPAHMVSLEKAWHGLHFLLTGEAYEGDGPLAFLLAGGEQLSDDDDMPVRWFSPEETARIHAALSGVSDKQLWSRFDPQTMEQLGVYPGIWDEPEDDLKSEYVMYFQEMKKIVAVAAKAGQGLVVSIG
jgi:hypothetical protein